jgi:hypothetical protein
MQQLLDAVRATGATNVVLTSTNSYASDLSEWPQYKPNDSAKQGRRLPGDHHRVRRSKRQQHRSLDLGCVAGDNSFVLITDAAGAPSQGYGTHVNAHYLCRSTGTAICN